MMDKISHGILQALAHANDQGQALYGYLIRRDINERQGYSGYITAAGLYTRIAKLRDEGLIHQSGDVVSEHGRIRTAWVITRPGLAELERE